MATDISSTNSIKNLTAGIDKLGDLKKASEAEIKDLFDDSYFNGGEPARKDIDEQIKKIENEIKSWEKTLKGYQDEMKKIQDKIDGVSGELADKTAERVSAQNKYEAELQTAINQAIVKAVNNTKRKNSAHPGQTSFQIEYKNALETLMTDGALANISSIYNEEGDLAGELGGLGDKLNLYITDSNNAMKGLKNAQAVITLLNNTKDNMVAQQNNYYKNANNDAKVPVFTYEKEVIVADIAEDLGVELGSREDKNAVTTGGASTRNEAEIAKITNSIHELAAGKTAGTGDSRAYGADNTLMQALETALFGDNKDATTIQEGSLVWQLAQNGANNSDIMAIIETEFKGVGISKSGDSYSIPYGHRANGEAKATDRIISGRAPEIFSAVMSIANNTSGMPEPATTTPANEGDMEKAMKAVDAFAAKGLSFKEAMYTLDQFFPGLDIGYALGEQAGTKEGIVRFNSDPSYTPLAEKIKSFTGADGVWKDSQVVQAEKKPANEPVNTSRNDPISIQDGNSRFYFMADDGNGHYDGVTDLLGYDGNEGMKGFNTKYGIPEGQTVIEGDALKNIMMMKLEEIDNGDGTVSVQQSFMSAANAGITKIDLTPTNKGDSYNINNSQIQTTFNVTMNGDTKTAEQSMEDEDYISATLNNKGITGTNMFSQLTDAQINSAFDNPLTGDAARVYELAETVNEQAKDLKDKLDKKGGNLDFEGEDEASFRKKIKQELDEANELAEVKGDALYREIEAEYDNQGDFGGWYNKKDKGLHEEIQDMVTKEMQDKGYENYGTHKEIELQDN